MMDYEQFIVIGAAIVIGVFLFFIWNSGHVETMHQEQCSNKCFSENKSYLFIRPTGTNLEQCICSNNG